MNSHPVIVVLLAILLLAATLYFVPLTVGNLAADIFIIVNK